MRRTAALLLAAATLTTGAVATVSSGVGAAPPRVGKLISQCNSAGQVALPTGVSTYQSGSARLSRDCFIMVPADSRLLLRDVRIVGPHNLYILGDLTNAARSKIIVRNSTISVGGDLYLTAGRGAQQSYSPGAEVVVANSTLRGDFVGLYASVNTRNGSVLVLDSRVVARDRDVNILASTYRRANGVVRVQRNEIVAAVNIALRTGRRGTSTATANALDAGGDLKVLSGFRGTTKFLRNTLDVDDEQVGTGAQGTCVAGPSNTPTVTCD